MGSIPFGFNTMGTDILDVEIKIIKPDYVCYGYVKCNRRTLSLKNNEEYKIVCSSNWTQNRLLVNRCMTLVSWGNVSYFIFINLLLVEENFVFFPRLKS